MHRYDRGRGGRWGGGLLSLSLLHQVLRHCLLVEFIGFSFFYGERVVWTVTEAGAQAIAEVVANQFGLPVDDLDRPFGTGGNTESTTITTPFIYLNYLSSRHSLTSTITDLALKQ
jgi:hypothetical protein